MKQMIKGLLSGLLVLSLAGCGGGKSSENGGGTTSAGNEHEGKYNCYSMKIDNIEYGAGEEYIELKSGDKAVSNINGEEEDCTYSISGSSITFNLPDYEFKGSIKNGLIILEDGTDLILSFAKEGVEAPDITPKAAVDPMDLALSYEYLNEDPESAGQDQTLPQYWYTYGNPSGNDYIWFSEQGYLSSNGGDFQNYVVDGMHVLDEETNGEGFDIIFPDMFTAYDIVSGMTFARSNEIQLLNSLCGRDWVSEDGSSVYRFYEDYTFENEFPSSGDVYNGTWYMEDGNHLWNEDENGDGSRVSIFYDRNSTGFEVRGLCEALYGNYYVPAK